MVTTPRPKADPVRQVEFVRLRENRVLAVFVSEAGIVTNKLVQLEQPCRRRPSWSGPPPTSTSASPPAGGAATSLATLRERILEDMRDDHIGAARADAEGAAARRAGLRRAGRRAGRRVLVDGEASFLDAPEFADVQKARALLKAFAEKDRILRVLDRVLRSQEVQIFIGAESEFATVPDVSVVAAPYGRGRQGARHPGGGRADPHELRPGHPAGRPDGPGALPGAGRRTDG